MFVWLTFCPLKKFLQEVKEILRATVPTNNECELAIFHHETRLLSGQEEMMLQTTEAKKPPIQQALVSNRWVGKYSNYSKSYYTLYKIVTDKKGFYVGYSELFFNFCLFAGPKGVVLTKQKQHITRI